ncbi:hypothetical protein ACFL1Y_00290 [Patescibacteria group bacterium]
MAQAGLTLEAFVQHLKEEIKTEDKIVDWEIKIETPVSTAVIKRKK